MPLTESRGGATRSGPAARVMASVRFLAPSRQGSDWDVTDNEREGYTAWRSNSQMLRLGPVFRHKVLGVERLGSG
jgi:hypothetical protein